MSKKAKEGIIRKDDLVRVVTPAFFVRCGYPKCIETEKTVVLAQFGQQIDDLLKTCDVYTKGDTIAGTNLIWCGEDHVYRRTIEDIAKKIAYARLHTHGFGGIERAIYTRDIPCHKDQEFRVMDIQFVMTGTYSSPSWSRTFDGDEYEPGYLESPKRHKILWLHGCWDDDGYPLRIEACHVEKVKREYTPQIFLTPSL